MARFQDTFVGARVYNNANISIPDNTVTVLTFNSERWDTDTIHSVAANTNRMTIFTAGKYYIWGGVDFASNNAGARRLAFIVDNTTTIAWLQIDSAQDFVDRMMIAAIWDLTVGQYLEFNVFQNSGGALNVNTNSAISPEFSIHRIG